MDTELLTTLGLNETQSTAYLYMIREGSTTPARLAVELGIKRPNAYAVLDQLKGLGLVRQNEQSGKIRYHVESPLALQELAHAKKLEALKQENEVTETMPQLMSYYHTYQLQPGVQFFRGASELKKLYADMLTTGKDLYVIRSLHDHSLLGSDFYQEFKAKKAACGITTYLLNPEHNPNMWNNASDKAYKTKRKQIDPECYQAPAEITIYGDKVAHIAFGDDALGMIISSPAIAQAQRELFMLAYQQRKQKQ